MTINDKRKPADGVRPPADVVEAVMERVAKASEKAVAADLGLSRSVIARLRHGSPCRQGTIDLARIRLGLAS